MGLSWIFAHENRTGYNHSMLTTLSHWLASLLVLGSLALPAIAQDAEREAIKGRRPPVPEAVVAFLITVVVLGVVCVPTRR